MKTIDTVHVTAHSGGIGSGLNAPLAELDEPVAREVKGEPAGHYTHCLLLTADDVRKRFGLVLEEPEAAPKAEAEPKAAPKVLTSDSVGEPTQGAASPKKTRKTK